MDCRLEVGPRGFHRESVPRWNGALGVGLGPRVPLGQELDPAATRPLITMDTLYLRPDAFHGEWNYSLLPRQPLLQE